MEKLEIGRYERSVRDYTRRDDDFGPNQQLVLEFSALAAETLDEKCWYNRRSAQRHADWLFPTPAQAFFILTIREDTEEAWKKQEQMRPRST